MDTNTMNNIKIVAIVDFNGHPAYVFDREPEFKYREISTPGGKTFLYAEDSGIINLFHHRLGSRDAFAGRKFRLTMEDGSTREIQHSWWDEGYSDISTALGKRIGRLTMGTVEGLKKCYVFCGCYADLDIIDSMDKPNCYYPYWDYEKVLKYDDLRYEHFYQQEYFKRTKRHLINKIREFKKGVTV